MRKRERYSNFNCGCVLGLLVLAIILLAPILLRFYIEYTIRNHLGPQDYKEFVRYFDQPIELPKEWQAVAPYSEKLLAGRTKLDDELSQWAEQEKHFEHPEVFKKFNDGIEFTPQDWEEAQTNVNGAESLLQAIEHFISYEDYEVQAWPQPDPKVLLANPNAASRNTFIFQTASRCFVIRGLLYANERRWEEAFNSNLMVLHMSSRHPAGRLIDELVALACEMLACKYQSNLVAECEDSKLLTETLQEMNALDGSLNHITTVNPYLIEIIGGLRQHKRNGIEIDLSVKEPTAYFVRILCRHGLPGRPQPRLTGFAKLGNSLLGPQGLIGRLLGIERLGMCYSMPNFQEIQIRKQSARAQYDLARLRLVNRILELEGGQKISNTEDIAPKFIQQKLIDPFSEKPYLWDVSTELFYSIGPNKINEENAFRYSPTNGSKSAGDLSLP